MPDLGFLRGAITLVTLLTFLGICWWAYRPENRDRFEEDGLLAFGDEDPEHSKPLQSDEKNRFAESALHEESDRVAEPNVEESQA